MQQNVLDFDVPVCDRWVLAMHVKSATAEILEYMDNLLLLQAFSTVPHQKIEQCSLRAELVYYVNLLQPVSSAG